MQFFTDSDVKSGLTYVIPVTQNKGHAYAICFNNIVSAEQFQKQLELGTKKSPLLEIASYQRKTIVRNKDGTTIFIYLAKT